MEFDFLIAANVLGMSSAHIGWLDLSFIFLLYFSLFLTEDEQSIGHTRCWQQFILLD